MAKPGTRPRRTWRHELASFGYAFRGIREATRSEPHLWFHAAATVLVIGVGVWLDTLSRTDWALLVLAMGSVWSAELMNTAVEAVVDLVSPAYHPLAGRAKDVAAGAVLVTALAAVGVGLLVLGPPLWARVLLWL